MPPVPARAVEAAFPGAAASELPRVHLPGGATCGLAVRSKGAGRKSYTLGCSRHLHDTGAAAGDRLAICMVAGGRLEIRVGPAAPAAASWLQGRVGPAAPPAASRPEVGAAPDVAAEVRSAPAGGAHGACTGTS